MWDSKLLLLDSSKTTPEQRTQTSDAPQTAGKDANTRPLFVQ